MAKALAYFDEPNDYSNWVSGTGIVPRPFMASLTYDSDTKAAVGLYGGSTPDSMEADISAHALAEGWMGLYLDTDFNSGAEDEAIVFVGDQGNDLFRMVVINSSEHWKIQRWDGSAWQDIGSTITTASLGVTQRLDFHWNVADSGGVFEVCIAGAAPIATFSGDTFTTADTEIHTIRLQSPSNSTQIAYFSHMVVDAADTRKRHTYSSITSSEGTYQEADGTESAVDENWGSGNFADFMTLNANERQTFNMNGFVAQVTNSVTIDEVVVAMNSKANSEPGLNVRAMMRIGGTDYDSANAEQPMAGHDEDYQLFPFENDPSTGVAWVNKDAVLAAEMGFRSV